MKSLHFAAVLVAATTLSAHAQDAKPAKVQETGGALFGVRESVEHIDISPDGKRIVFIAPGAGRISSAYVANLEGGEPILGVQSGGNPENLQRCNFATNTRLICQATGVTEVDGVLVGFSRQIAVDDDGTNPANVGQEDSNYGMRLRQFDSDILDWLPDEEGQVLVARDYVPEHKSGTKLMSKLDGIGVDKIDVRTMTVKKVEGANKLVDFFITDGRGNVRIKGYQPRRLGIGNQESTRIIYHYRLPGSMEWQPFSEWDQNVGMAPIAVDAGSNAAYVLKLLNGRKALYRVKLDGSMETELVYKNDKVDVDDVVRIGRDSRVIGVTYAEEVRHIVYFDEEYAKLAESLGKALPSLPMVNFISASTDNSKLLLRAGSDSDPGRYYVYDKTGRSLNEIMLARPSLEHVKLASVRPITYPAADGTPIPGYLTLPPGKEDARGLPAVVLPHGGPSARDEWGFDWLAQFIAHQGFAVLQPNFRGSAGFGDAWLRDNGFRSWRTSVGDVTDAGKWLVAQGIADPGKLAIVGWSYGGYAALQSGVIEPSLFKAIVAIAPVTDLELVKTEARDYTNYRTVVDEIGIGPHVAQGSPLQNVDRIIAPVLMFHGSMDQNVRAQQSLKMDEKLRAAGKSSELLTFPGLEHSLVDSNARAYMLNRIAAFLNANTGAN